MGELLRVEHLKKYFPTPNGILHAVDDVTLTINEGETLGVVGESGCGKSTLGRVILKLLDPTEGKIYFNGRDVTNISPQENIELRKEMQLIFQDPYSSLNPRMCVKDLIGDPLDTFHMYSKAERDKAAKEPIKTFEEEPGLKILNGRYGPYISFEGKNYRIPKGKKPEALTLEECREIIKK